MQVPLVIASDFTGLIEAFIALILWAFGVLFVIIAMASKRSRNRGNGAGAP